jgi:hypothetical protein
VSSLRPPTDSIIGLVVWIIGIVVLAIVAVFLFQNIVLPMIRTVT